MNIFDVILYYIFLSIDLINDEFFIIKNIDIKFGFDFYKDKIIDNKLN